MSVLRALGLGILVAASFSAASVAANERTKVVVASTFPSSTPVLGDVFRDLPEKLSRLSDGALVLEFHEPGSLVPGGETVEATADGRVDAAWAGAGWFSKKDSAFNLFSSVPFGPGIGEYMAWMYEGGGLELAREMFHANGVHNIPCGMIPPEASGWFHKEIRTIDDLQGLKMRFFGLGARIMERHGVETQQLPPGEILPALQSGEIDAAEFSLPAIDAPLGFSDMAKYYYFPGWHQQATLFDLYVNKDVWDKIPEHHQAAIEIGCGDSMRAMISRGEAAQWGAIQDLQERGVMLRRWPAEILVSFEDAWHEIAAEESRESANFERVYKSYGEFRQNYKIWKHFSFLQ